MPGHPAPSPEEEARLRRLLADARHEAPLPGDVAARLDDVLGRLEAGEDVPSGVSGTGVLELAAARRRRVASMLVAAAAVVVLGVGLGQVVDGGDGSGGDAASSGVAADESADELERPERDQDPDRGDDEGTDSGAQQDAAPENGLTADQEALSSRSARGVVVLDSRVVRVAEDSFSDDAARVQRRAVRIGGGPSARLQRLAGAPRPATRAWQDCAAAEWGEGIAVAVLYDDEPAVLAFRPPAGDSQVVDLLQCGTGGVLRTTTLPRR